MRPVDTIAQTLGCEKETAEQVQRHLAAVLNHKPTAEFLAIYGFTARTTKGRNDIESDVAEGRRQIVLFLAACARRGGDLAMTATTGEGNDE